MNDYDLELFEAELQRLKPAPLPDELAAKLATARPSRREIAAGGGSRPLLEHLLPRWLLPLAAAAGLALVSVWLFGGKKPGQESAATLHPPAGITADDVEVGHRLVSTFDTVARLPDGSPVRFRCEQWVDEVVVRDSSRQIQVERRKPRLEVLPVRLETY